MNEPSGTNPSVARLSAPPAAESRYIPIIAAKVGITTRAVLLGGEVAQCETHWLENRTVPHVIPTFHCEGCKLKRPKRYKAYLSAWLPGASRCVIVELTLDAVRNVPGICLANFQLRGRTISLSRVGKVKNAPVRVELGPLPKSIREVGPMPDAFDVWDTLYRLWGIDRETGTDDSPDMTKTFDLDGNLMKGGSIKRGDK